MQAHGEDGSAYLLTFWTYGGAPIFADPLRAALFCRVLGSLRQRLGFRLHAYVILPDRVRLIVGARDPDARWVRIVAQRLKSRFAREVNARSGRLGLVWQDADQRLPLRDRDDLGRRAEFLHRCPVIARLALTPGDWRYSSFRAWAGEGRTPAPVDLPEAARPAAPARRPEPPRGPIS